MGYETSYGLQATDGPFQVLILTSRAISGGKDFLGSRIISELSGGCRQSIEKCGMLLIVNDIMFQSNNKLLSTRQHRASGMGRIGLALVSTVGVSMVVMVMLMIMVVVVMVSMVMTMGMGARMVLAHGVSPCTVDSLHSGSVTKKAKRARVSSSQAFLALIEH